MALTDYSLEWFKRKHSYASNYGEFKRIEKKYKSIEMRLFNRLSSAIYQLKTGEVIFVEGPAIRFPDQDGNL